jgi:eukaryotic-like serine/threonine-protein kinase
VRLRRKLGEPPESLARFNQPLEIATSASLEALQAGTEGTKLFLAGNPQAALTLYQRGIELDPFIYTGLPIARANDAEGQVECRVSLLQQRDRRAR